MERAQRDKWDGAKTERKGQVGRKLTRMSSKDWFFFLSVSRRSCTVQPSRDHIAHPPRPAPALLTLICGRVLHSCSLLPRLCSHALGNQEVAAVGCTNREWWRRLHSNFISLSTCNTELRNNDWGIKRQFYKLWLMLFIWFSHFNLH